MFIVRRPGEYDKVKKLKQNPEASLTDHNPGFILDVDR